MGEGLRLALLGGAEVQLDGAPVSGFYSSKAQALLFYLAVAAHPREVPPYTRSGLAGVLWADMPESAARTNLRQVLSNLRRLVGPHLDVTRQSVAFKRDSPYWLDVEAFQACVADAADTEDVVQLREAVELYQGGFLAGFYVRDAPRFEEWALAQGERLRTMALHALHALAERYAARGDFDHGTIYARRLLELEPWHEGAHRMLMSLLARGGQRAAALAQYERCRQVLRDELDVEPGAETTALYRDIQAERVGGRARQSRPRHNLPVQTTPFVGRARELADLSRLLSDPATRLVTILAPGGMGKTRLALAAAKNHLETSQDQVCFVGLTPLTAAEDLVPAIAAAAGYPIRHDERPPQQQLLDYLRPSEMLVVLDNMEQMLEGVDVLNAILQAAEGVKILVTSRQRLQLSGETIFLLDGMAYPDQETAEDAPAWDSVQLFMQSAQRTRSDFALAADELRYVARICRLVQGMPLAILLAAAWVDVLSPQEIGDEIGNSLDFLATDWRDVPDRQRSLRAVFDHSWGRLDEAERDTFLKLSVFRGGVTRDAAQAVTGAALGTLSALSSKSFLQREANGRYTVHELLRHYAAAELQAVGLKGAARDGHCHYYTGFLGQREADLKGQRQVAALDEIEADFENIRAAWRWAVSRKSYGAVGSALESLFFYCNMRNRYQEILELLRLAREHLAPVARERPHPVWGRVMSRTPMAGRVFLEPFDEIRERLETSLRIARENGDQSEVAYCLWRLGVAVVNAQDDISGALAYCEKSLAHYRALDDRYYLAQLLDNTGICYVRAYQPERGTQLIQQGANLRRKQGDRIGLSHSLDSLGWIAYHDGRYAEAEVHWQEGYQLACETGERQEKAFMRMGLAWLRLFNRGDFAAAQALAEEVQTIALAINSREGKRRAQILFGFLAGLREDYVACRRLMGHVAYRRSFTYNISWMMMGFCLAACGLDEMQTAAQHLRQVLEMSRLRQWPAVMAQCLPYAALVKTDAGDPERAVELLALASHHPLSPKGWLAQWPLLARLRAGLEAALPGTAYAEAWERGRTLDLEATVRALLDEASLKADGNLGRSKAGGHNESQEMMRRHALRKSDEGGQTRHWN
jgi:predicted ATPase/DNA-binding SARP family transcriptional activator